MSFPSQRPRRLRGTDAVRSMICETRLSREQLVLPLFVKQGRAAPEPVASMPGVFRWPVSGAVELCRKANDAGIPAILLFGITDAKDEEGTAAWDDGNVVTETVRAIKKNAANLCVMTDVCLCGYTSHGHCGVLREGKIDNDATLDRLSRVALCHARAGADFVAPSDMMDGRVGHIRAAMDAHGFADTGILSYAVKYASAFYGPFRDAAGSAPAFGDRRTHQMNPANAREAIREAVADAAEGADMVMVKPALAYLDIIRRVRETVNLPVVAYNVSGEYAMVKAAAAAGWIDEKAVVLESLTGMARAGADIIITYHALDAAGWIGEMT
jgi:porphobilinogen synthase